MRRPWIVAVALLSAAVGVAWAQTSRPEPKGPVMTLNYVTVEKVKGSTSSLRDKIVVVVFFKPGESGTDEALKLVASEATSLGGVAAVGVCLSADENQARDMVKKVNDAFPIHFDPKAGGVGLSRQWGIRATPYCVVLDPDGRLAASCPPSQLAERLRTQLRLTPPRETDKATLAEGGEKVGLAERMLKSGNLRGCLRYLSQVPEESRTDPGVSKRVSDLTLAIEPLVPGLIEVSEGLIKEEKWGEALLMLEQLAGAMKNTPAFKGIEDQLFSITDDPDLKVKAVALMPEALAADELANARDRDEMGDRVGAYVLLGKLAAERGTTQAASEARRIMSAWESDPAQRRTLHDALHGEKANALLSTGDSYAAAKLTDKARGFYQQVLTNYPHTTAAEKARAKLDALK